jgi:outer membrane protein
MTKLAASLCLFCLPASAQEALTLREAARKALESHPSVEAMSAGLRAAASRIQQAKAGRLPKVAYTESYQRSDNPVFVFSGLLSQRRFTEGNFAIGTLNHPDFFNNFQSQLSVEQTVYDFGQTRSLIGAAETSRKMTAEDDRLLRQNLVAAVVRAYYGAALAAKGLDVAREAVRSAEADLKRAEAVRAAGMSTDADVLSIRVHLAAMREQQIRSGYELEVAGAALNELMGLPFETRHDLTTPLVPLPVTPGTLADYQRQAAAERPEVRRQQLALDMAGFQSSAARSALLPQISLRGLFESDRGRFYNQAAANWFAGVSLRWNLFDGNSGRARYAETRETMAGARAGQRQTASTVKLEVLRRHADLQSAGERIQVASAVVAQAEESLRITRNRYEGGLTTVTELLRSETALTESATRRLAAIHDQRVAAAFLELAAGVLSGDSDVLK